MDARMARNNGYKPVPYGRGIPKAVSDTVVIYPYNDIEGTAAILEENEDEVGALIVEPVLCGPGVIVPKGNYLKRLRQLTRKRHIVLIFDEVSPLPPGVRRRARILRRPAGHDDLREDRGRRIPARGIRRRVANHGDPEPGRVAERDLPCGHLHGHRSE